VLEAVRAAEVSEVVVAENARATGPMRELIREAERSGATVSSVPRADLDRIAANNGGVAARGSAVTHRTLNERDVAGFAFGDDDVVVVLDGITDPQNLGAAARSAEAAGASLIVTRIHRAAGPTPAAIRASAGALSHVPLARVANIARAVDRLRAIGFTSIGMAGDAPRSVFDEPCPPGRVAIVVGSEGAGLSRLVRERCDILVSLPMMGRVGSLNASAALAAVLYSYVLPARRGDRRR
jgi:23S rRNA (guanosine2251-2'-O)-methyltransferase